MSISGESKKKSRKPVEHPNTLQSRSVGRILDLISEGPIEGLFDQDNPEKSIYMDETPVMNADGSYNFEGVTVVERYGESDQDAIPGFAQVETEQSISQPLTNTSPVTFTVTDSDVKQVRVKVRVNALHTQNQDNGDVLPATVILKAELGSTAVSTASVVDELPLTTGVASVTITAGGTSYTHRPTVVFSGGDGSGAAGTVVMSDEAGGTGSVVGVTITSNGSGYTEPPNVSFSLATGGFDKEAEATSVLQAAGGTGYTSAPSVTISGGGGTGAEAIAEVSGGSVTGLFLTTSVADVKLLEGGSDYQETTVQFSGGGGTGATAIATVVDGVVEDIEVTSGGSGYGEFPPDVTVTGGTGSGFVGTATLTDGVVTGVTITDGGTGYPSVDVQFGLASGSGATAYARITGRSGPIASIHVSNGGSGYVIAPTVVISGGSGSGATATATISGGVVTGVTVTNGGTGYYAHTTDIYFTGGFADGTGSGAAARAVLTAGRVTDITMINGGSGYTLEPAVSITNTNGTGTGALTRAVGKLAGGSGYTTAPTVSFSGGGGSGATAIAKISPYHLYGGHITLSGKCVGPYEEAYLLDFARHSDALVDAGVPALTYPISVRISRVSEDSDAITVTDEVSVVGYTEIQPYNLSYPDSAMIALTLDAQKFGGSIPRRSYDVKGKKVRVPKGYDPDGTVTTGRTYPDFWDGTFEEKWTDNPAWILLDALTDTRYGAGIPLDMVDVYSLYQVSKYCDEVISHEVVDDHGTSRTVSEFRYTLNTVIASRREAHQVVQAIASTFRGMVYWSSGGVAFSQDKPKTATRLVAPADVVDGQFSYSSTARKARHSAALISWNNPDDGFAQDIEVFEDSSLIDRYGYNPIEIVAYGTTSRSQARRLGRWIIDSETNETDTVTFRGGLDFSDMFPGEVFAVADPTKQGARLGGRIMSWNFRDLAPTGAATSTTEKDGAIGSINGEQNAVFRCRVHVPSEIVSGTSTKQCIPAGCIWEVGNSTTGAYLGFDGNGDLVLRAGYGGSDLAGNVNDVARLTVANSQIPLDREIELLAEIRVGSSDEAGRVRLWINNQFMGESVTGDGSSLLGGSFDSDTGAKFGGSSGDIVAGEKSGYAQDVESSSVEIRSSLDYWANSVARPVSAEETLSDEIASGAAVTSVATYSGAAASIHRDASGAFECSITTPASGTTPTGLIFEVGDGSSSGSEGHYVGFDAEGNLILHAGDGGATPDTSESCSILVPANQFKASTQYHLLWDIEPAAGRMSLWIDWEYFTTAQTEDSTALGNGQFADSQGGGYGVLGTNTVTGMVATVFNGTFDTPLRYYEGALITDNTNAYSHGSVTLDQAYVVQSGDRLLFMTNEATVDSLALQPGTTGDTVELLEPPTRIPVDNGMYVIQAAAANPKEYRVLSVRELEDLKFEVVGLQYDKTKFDRIEKDLIVDQPVTSLFPTGAMTPPTNLSFLESLYRADGQVLTKIDLSCSPSTDPRVNLYQFDVRRPSVDSTGTATDENDWEVLLTHSSPTATVFNAETGVWGFRVTAIGGNAAGTVSPPVVLDQVNDSSQLSTVYGKRLPPSNVTGLTVSRGFSRVKLNWTAVSDLDLKDYAIFVGETWPADNVGVIYVDTTEYLSYVNTTSDLTFLVRARDTTLNLSTSAAKVEASLLALDAVTDLEAHQVYTPENIYSGKAQLSWKAQRIHGETIEYEVRSTTELNDANPGGDWAASTVRGETATPSLEVKVPLSGGNATTYEFKVRSFVELESGERNYGTETSIQLSLHPGQGSTEKAQNEHTTWSSLSSNEAVAFLTNGRSADQTTAKDTIVNAAYGGGWVASASSPEFDRHASGVWRVTLNVSSSSTPVGCIWEMGNAFRAAYLGFDGNGDLIFRAGDGGGTSANVNMARVVISNSSIPTDTDFEILCEIRNDGVNSGRVRVWLDNTLTATGETSDASTFSDQIWSANRDGKVNGFYESIALGETGSYSQTVTTSGVTFVTGVEYWHDTLVANPFEISGGDLILSEGVLYGAYIYDFNLTGEKTGEVNLLPSPRFESSTRLKIFDTQNDSLFDYGPDTTAATKNLKITPAVDGSIGVPKIQFFIDPEATGTYRAFRSGTAYTFTNSKIKLEMRQAKGDEYRPALDALTTTFETITF